MPNDRGWRSSAEYEYIDQLNPGELAWEFLRRNPDYKRRYRELVSARLLADKTANEFAHAWGLRFRGRPQQFGP